MHTRSRRVARAAAKQRARDEEHGETQERVNERAAHERLGQDLRFGWWAEVVEGFIQASFL